MSNDLVLSQLKLKQNSTSKEKISNKNNETKAVAAAAANTKATDQHPKMLPKRNFFKKETNKHDGEDANDFVKRKKKDKQKYYNKTNNCYADVFSQRPTIA